MWLGSTLYLSIFQTMPMLPKSNTPYFSASETSETAESTAEQCLKFVDERRYVECGRCGKINKNCTAQGTRHSFYNHYVCQWVECFHGCLAETGPNELWIDPSMRASHWKGIKMTLPHLLFYFCKRGTNRNTYRQLAARIFCWVKSHHYQANIHQRTDTCLGKSSRLICCSVPLGVALFGPMQKRKISNTCSQ